MQPKTKKILIIVVAVLLIATVLYFVFRKPKVQTQDPLINPNPNPSNTTPTNTTPPINDTFPLRVGSKGENVKRLQIALNKINPNNKLSYDSNFGNQTRIAIITSLATSLYSLGPEITEAQLNKLIQLGNNA